MVRKSLSGILAAAVLISSITTAFADNTFQNSTALNDVLKNSRVSCVLPDCSPGIGLRV